MTVFLFLSFSQISTLTLKTEMHLLLASQDTSSKPPSTLACIKTIHALSENSVSLAQRKPLSAFRGHPCPVNALSLARSAPTYTRSHGQRLFRAGWSQGVMPVAHLRDTCMSRTPLSPAEALGCFGWSLWPPAPHLSVTSFSAAVSWHRGHSA
ncbi:hypothetical protein H8959_019985 [Pygathrix nigripes]